MRGFDIKMLFVRGSRLSAHSHNGAGLWLRDATALPPEQAEERVMLSNEYEQLCFVCYRVADAPTPRVPSVQWPCAGCDVPIWVPKKSPVALPKICIHCTGG